MVQDNEILDSKFFLDWNENPKRFNFYLEKFVPCTSLVLLSNIIYFFIVFVVSESLVLFVLNNIPSLSEGSYNLFKNVFIFGGVLLFLFLLVASLLYLIIEFVFIKPRFKFNKKSKIYITDGNGFYIVDYVVGSTSRNLPTLSDKIVYHFSKKNVKLYPEFINSVCYLDSYNVVDSSEDSLILDIPSESRIYDDINDIEITSSVKGFSKLQEYIDNTEGGYYLD